MLASPHILDAVVALRFKDAQLEGLRNMSEQSWQQVLPVCDLLHLTIPLRRTCGDDLPDWVCNRIDRNISDNSERFERIKATYIEVADCLHRHGLEHVVLKGFSQAPDFIDHPRFRMQSDLDIFCPQESVLAARKVLREIGYEAKQGFEHQLTDHLPTLLRPSSWQWAGNAFDPSMPLSIELHYRFWDPLAVRIQAHGVERFWNRRVERCLEDLTFPSLSSVDAIGYAAVHVFKHLLRGELLPSHVFELAYVLNRHSGHQALWNQWRILHSSSLRQIESVSFYLAALWFHCSVPPQVEEEIRSLPAGVHRWFQAYSESPLDALVRPNKNSVWLHLALLDSRTDQLRVFCTSLLPVRVPPQNALRSWSVPTIFRFLRYACSRLSYHLWILPRTIAEGIFWWMGGKFRPGEAPRIYG